MNRWRVGEDRGSKEKDRCPLTEIESTDTAVKRCMQALIDCGAISCFIDIEWAKLNNIPTRPLTRPISVYNVDSTANNTGAITYIADIILRNENHSEHTQLALTCLGKQSLILGYNWLHNHNPEINWQTVRGHRRYPRREQVSARAP
jgi:hypothetical protein